MEIFSLIILLFLKRVEHINVKVIKLDENKNKKIPNKIGSVLFIIAALPVPLLR